jgi:hypothetical protein
MLAAGAASARSTEAIAWLGDAPEQETGGKRDTITIKTDKTIANR